MHAVGRRGVSGNGVREVRVQYVSRRGVSSNGVLGGKRGKGYNAVGRRGVSSNELIGVREVRGIVQ